MPATTQSFAAAMVDAIHDALTEDRRVSLIGSHVLGLGPQRHLMDRVRADFPDRIVDPPTAEAGIAAAGAGAAMAGARPFVDLGTAAFSFLAFTQIVNEAAVAHYMTNGAIDVPVTYHMLHGVRGGGAAQHSHSPQSMLWNAPGLEIVLPSTPADAYGLIRSALASRNPTVLLTHAKLLGIEGPMPSERKAIPFGKADIKRAGRDVTIVATSLMVQYALAAATTLAGEGIEAEVVDPRTLVPLDEATILASVERTGRLVVVDECPLRCGIASEISATVAERGFRFLKGPIVRVARADTPIAFAEAQEDFVTPDAAKIAAAARRVLG
jgi:acetoin:2,6-dichlorophenolindophenol oxidoreductase subunit beta